MSTPANDPLETGGIYRIQSRNLVVGAFLHQAPNDPWPWFIGIREKFGYRYLFSEYGWAWQRIGNLPASIRDTVPWSELAPNKATLRRSLAQHEGRIRRAEGRR